jgi:transcriptional regulator with GAF, ATPase, and Fis domain
MSSDREDEVLSAVVSLVDSLLDDFDVVELLTDLTERCVGLLDVASSGLLLADARGQLHLMAATSKSIQALELLQLQRDEGPCLDCFATGKPVSVPDLEAESSRWPQFVPAALDSGHRSVHAIPMRAAGTVIGALGLFGASTGSLDSSDLAVASTLAHVATVAILQEHAPSPIAVMPRLRSALSSRVVVEQAKGYLHERLDVPLDMAFELLRRHARARDLHLTDVARTLISSPSDRAGIESALSADMADADAGVVSG